MSTVCVICSTALLWSWLHATLLLRYPVPCTLPCCSCSEACAFLCTYNSLNDFCSVKHTLGCLCFLGQRCFFVHALFVSMGGATPAVHANCVPNHLLMIFAYMCLYNRIQSEMWSWETRKLSHLSMGCLAGRGVFFPSYCPHTSPLLCPLCTAALPSLFWLHC